MRSEDRAEARRERVARMLLCFSRMILQLVYTSTATVEFWPDDLLNLVEKARLNNGPAGLTGMLLFHQKHFLQLLEGPEIAVRNLFDRIAQDPRHTNIRVLLSELVPARSFAGWTMGFEQVEDAWNLPPAWTTILEEELPPSIEPQPGSAARDLLLSFAHGLDASAAAG